MIPKNIASEDNKPIVKDCIDKNEIKGCWKLGKLQNILSVIANHDKSLEKRKHVLKIISWCMGLSALASLFFKLSSTQNNVADMVLGTTVFTFIAMVMIYYQYKRLDLPNEFRVLTIPFLELLEQDIDRNNKIALSMPLKRIEMKEYITFQDNGRRNNYSFDDTIYSREFLRMQATLIDGNLLTLVGHESLKKSKRRKRSASGKTKIKTKYKKQTVLSTSLTINQMRYLDKNANSENNDILAKDKKENRIIRIKTKEKLTKEDSPNVDNVIENIFKLYQQLESISVMAHQS